MLIKRMLQNCTNQVQVFTRMCYIKLDLSLKIDNELERCLHGKTQNANESFNGTIWERIPKIKYVSPSDIEVGVSNVVANFNSGMKWSILIYEKLNIIPWKVVRILI